MKRPQSLAARLFGLTALWSLFALFIAAIILTSLYQRSVEQGFDKQLHIYLKNIAADVTANASTNHDSLNLGEANFQSHLSGWYWQVYDLASERIVSASVSLSSETLNVNASQLTPSGAINSGYTVGPEGRRLRVMQRNILVDDGRRYTITVAGNDDEIRQDIMRFRRSVAITLFAFGLGLGVMLFVLMRYGLRPLSDLRTAIADIRRGQARRLDENYPDEIAPLVKELNQLIEANRQVVERARTQVGNLAHALKTPLSVVTNEADARSGPFASKVTEQAHVMRDQIDYYLNRAHVAASRDLAGANACADTVIGKLVGAMRQIHLSKSLTFHVSGATGITFRGEQQDLEEMVGNLLDNAAKWAKTRVQVRVDAVLDDDLPSKRAGPMAAIIVSDDGPGLDEALFEQVLMRGRRLDETVPGSGLGLAIVHDLVSLYGGSLDLSRSELGGLQARLMLPVAR